MINKLKEFFKTKLGIHIYSFAKTYVTVFLGIYLTLTGVLERIDFSLLPEVNLIDINVFVAAAKGALFAVLRNIYKLLTE